MNDRGRPVAGDEARRIDLTQQRVLGVPLAVP
jgi:hypothetical protein